MTQLIIPNVPSEMVGDLSHIPVEKRKSFGLGSQRMLWYARDGDVVVLPTPPGDEFLAHVASLTGVDANSLRFVHPPAGEFGTEILTADRLVNSTFHEQLRDTITDRDINAIIALYVDVSITQMATACGLDHALPGIRFSNQDGDTLANSKTVFRAIASANGVPVAPGGVSRLETDAVSRIETILSTGHPVMVKQQFSGGGLGNEILVRDTDVEPKGASTVHQLSDEIDVRKYVGDRWEWLTGHHGHSMVIERFFEQPTTVYAEFVVTDEGADLRGTGEILMEPTAIGEIIPPQSVEAQQIESIIDAASKICAPYQQMGYRGTLCVDGLVTPNGEIYFTEVNGRLTASSHLHVNLIDHVVGADWRKQRVFMEKAAYWPVPNFRQALVLLKESGLEYDPDTKLGVILTADYAAVTGRVTYCVVAKSVEDAKAFEEKLLALTAEAAT